jgi:ferredoxin
MNIPYFPVAQAGPDAATQAALAALAALPATEAQDAVTYRSTGNTVVIGAGEEALALADYLARALPVTLLLREGTVAARSYPVFSAGRIALTGWLGAFAVRWQGGADEARSAAFDLVLDLGEQPLIGTHQAPHGYHAPGADPAARQAAADALMELVGDFEKPKYFAYRERLCAHGRNTLTGCNACVEICSAGAIAGAGDRIEVNPYLCAGCGACTTVCPTGALSYAYPSATQLGRRLKAALQAYRAAGGSAPVILFHDVTQATVHAPGVIPLALHHVASCGIDVWLSALAYGAAGVAVRLAGTEAPQYVTALERQMALAQAIMDGLGYAGPHFKLGVATPGVATPGVATPGDAAACARGAVPPEPATFDIAANKRDTLEYALDHLHRHAPEQPQTVALAAGAPFGAIALNTAACSLCMACVGACPAAALQGGDTLPQLRFVEKNCVQCGLCANTCPEQAIRLVPRMSFKATRNTPFVLHGSQPFHCIRCDKPFGTLQMIETMLARLGDHAAFAGKLERMKMCGDCRVVDMMAPQDEMRIIPLRRG